MEYIEQFIALGGWIVSVITTIITFMVARYKRHDADIVIMQERIVDLLEKNDRFINEINDLRKENAQLKANQAEMQAEIEILRSKLSNQSKHKPHNEKSTH